MAITWWELAIRIATAFALGTCIGLERQWRARMAGLRTNALVAVGAALFVLLSVVVPGDTSPTRIAAQVVSGIGFLGAGLIIRDGGSLRGINTAATIWGAAAVGCLAAAGQLGLAAGGTAAIILANLTLRPLARRVDQSTGELKISSLYQFRVTCQTGDEPHLRALLVQTVTGSGFSIQSIRSRVHGDATEILAALGATTKDTGAFQQVVARLGMEPGVSAVEWRRVEDDDEDEA